MVDREGAPAELGLLDLDYRPLASATEMAAHHGRFPDRPGQGSGRRSSLGPALEWPGLQEQGPGREFETCPLWGANLYHIQKPVPFVIQLSQPGCCVAR